MKSDEMPVNMITVFLVCSCTVCYPFYSFVTAVCPNTIPQDKRYSFCILMYVINFTVLLQLCFQIPQEKRCRHPEKEKW